MMDTCENIATDRTRCFWATQTCGCGVTVDSCGNECCLPGLSMADGRIATSDWVRGLVLNIINTDERRPPSECGSDPADVRGHWSESFIDDSGLYGGATNGYRVGTRLRYIDPSKYKIREIEALITAELTRTLQKLVGLGVARRIAVAVTYLGNNRFGADLSAYSSAGAPDGTVSIIGQRDDRFGFYWTC